MCSTHAWLMCFTDRGQLYLLRVFEIPEQAADIDWSGHRQRPVAARRGEDHQCDPGPRLRRGLSSADGHPPWPGQEDGPERLQPAQARGNIIGISLDEGDTLIGVALVRSGDQAVLCTRKGMAIRFAESDARAMGRNTRGVKGITLVGEDEVVGMVVADPEGYLLTVCEKGYGKRTPFGANQPAEAVEEVVEEALPSRRRKPLSERRGRGRGRWRALFGDAVSAAAARVRQGRA